MMMRRVAGRVLLQALGGRDAGFGRGRLAHLLPPIVLGLESSVITPRDGEGKRWGGALLRRRDEVEGWLITTTQTQKTARLTFRVDYYGRGRHVDPVRGGQTGHVPSALQSHRGFLVHSTSVDVVISDPSARGFQAQAAGSRRDTKGPAAAAAAAAGAAGAGLLS